MKKAYLILTLALFAVQFVSAAGARADEEDTESVTYNKGGLLFGAGYKENTFDGPSTTSNVGIHWRALSESKRIRRVWDDDYDSMSNGLEVNIGWNVLNQNTNSGEAVTGVKARVRGHLGPQIRGVGKGGCDVYAAISLAADGEGYTSAQENSNGIRGRIGPESGIECKKGKLLLQITPSVEFGGMNAFNGKVIKIGLDAALRARIAIGDKFYASIEGLVGPASWQGKTMESVGNKTFTTKELDFTADYQLTAKWAVGADAKFIRASGETPNGGEFSVHDLTVNGRAVRVF